MLIRPQSFNELIDLHVLEFLKSKKNWSKAGVQQVHLISILHYQSTQLIQKHTHIFPSLHFAFDTLKAALLTVLISLTRFNSKWALAFLISSLNALTIFLCSSQVARPFSHSVDHPLPLQFSSHYIPLLIHMCLLPSLPNFLLSGGAPVLHLEVVLDIHLTSALPFPGVMLTDHPI